MLAVKSAAERLGVSTATVWKLIRTGAIPVVRIGGRTLIEPAAIDKFVADHTEIRGGAA